MIAKIIPKTSPDGQQKPAEWTQVPSYAWIHLGSLIQTFETVFKAEMGSAATYVVPRRGLYSTAALVDEAETAFPPALALTIPDKAKADFHEAGRCLAFNLPTAAGFHSCRAVEGMIELYYQTFTGKTGTLNGWYDYIKALQSVIDSGTKPAPEAKTLHNLNQIKDFDRNPLMHPRQTLTELDARILFSQAEMAIIGMAQEVVIAAATGAAQAALALPPVAAANS